MRFYRHYKNKLYRHLGIARHSETLEKVVLYETLYQNDLGKLWVRPRAMFEEDIELDGVLGGFIDQKCVGFWAGYFEPKPAFVSWLGAVQKEFRNLGIAHDLFMKILEQLYAKGSQIVRVQVLNSSQDLLMFYLKNNFKIMGFESDDQALLEKV